ncbi:hypothetical protein ACES2L_12935 [Bdellovibrio bacteriovorus]
MGKILLTVLLLFAFSAEAKNPLPESTAKKIKAKISCVFKGKNNASPDVGTYVFPPDAEESVCNPLSSVPASSPENGLLGKLILRTPEMAKVNSVLDYHSKGQRLDKDLYFADINVPTRSFTEGFSTMDGQTLVNASGDKLIEHFAIEYTSSLKLTADDKEGAYELASLSDDGTRVFVQENGVWNEIINNDGTHPTRLGCSSRLISLNKGQELPIKVLYYQGPRYHVANVLMWRHVEKPKNYKGWRHGLCGMTSNTFFAKDKNGKKIGGMMALEKMGYTAISSKNYLMPEKKQNPCTIEELRISDHQLIALTSTKATISWKTNLPATSQLRILDLYTGEEFYTSIDSNLVTDHVAEINGLVPGGYYQIQSISKDSYGREVRSSFISAQPQ